MFVNLDGDVSAASVGARPAGAVPERDVHLALFATQNDLAANPIVERQLEVTGQVIFRVPSGRRGDFDFAPGRSERALHDEGWSRFEVVQPAKESRCSSGMGDV